MVDQNIEDQNIMLKAEIVELKRRLEEYEKSCKKAKKIRRSWLISLILDTLTRMENQIKINDNLVILSNRIFFILLLHTLPSASIKYSSFSPSIDIFLSNLAANSSSLSMSIAFDSSSPRSSFPKLCRSFSSHGWSKCACCFYQLVDNQLHEAYLWIYQTSML